MLWLRRFLLLLMSLFPLLPNQLGVEPDVTWRIGTGVFAFITVTFYVASGDLRLFRDANWLDQSGMIGDFILIVFLIANTLGYYVVSPAAVYIIALFWHLLSACVMFFMVFAPVWQAEDEDVE